MEINQAKISGSGQAVSVGSPMEDSDIVTNYTLAEGQERAIEHVQAFFKKLHDEDDGLFREYATSDMSHSVLENVFNEFSWRLYAESSNPFQREVSITAHRTRRSVDDALFSRQISVMLKIPRIITEILTGNPGSETCAAPRSLSAVTSADDDHDTGRRPLGKSREKILEWIDSVEPLDVAETAGLTDIGRTDDVELPELMAHARFIRESSAYEWLVSRIKRHSRVGFVGTDTMDQFGTELRRLLRTQDPVRKMSRKGPPKTVSATFNLEWSPVAFLETLTQGCGRTANLENVVCLTGSISESQATTVVEYLIQTWPVSAQPIFTLMQDLLSTPLGKAAYCESSII